MLMRLSRFRYISQTLVTQPTGWVSLFGHNDANAEGIRPCYLLNSLTSSNKVVYRLTKKSDCTRKEDVLLRIFSQMEKLWVLSTYPSLMRVIQFFASIFKIWGSMVTFRSKNAYSSICKRKEGVFGTSWNEYQNQNDCGSLKLWPHG